MKQRFRITAGLACAAIGLSILPSVEANQPYQTIVDRNIFNLSDPPPVVIEAPVAPEVPINVKFTGIWTAHGQKRAMFVIPGATPADTQYLSLSEDQSKGGIHVVKIMESSGEVEIRNGGARVVLNYTDHGLKPMAAPVQVATQAGSRGQQPQAGRAGAPPQPGVMPRPPGAVQLNAPGRGGVQVAPGTIRQAAPDTSSQPTAARTIPQRNMRAVPPSPGQGAAPQMDPVSERLLMEFQQEAAAQQGARLPPVPPMR